MSPSDKQSAKSLTKRAAVCLALVLLYGLFGTFLHGGSRARDGQGTGRIAIERITPVVPAR